MLLMCELFLFYDEKDAIMMGPMELVLVLAYPSCPTWWEKTDRPNGCMVFNSQMQKIGWLCLKSVQKDDVKKLSIQAASDQGAPAIQDPSAPASRGGRAR
jgi:hypothetical protein